MRISEDLNVGTQVKKTNFPLISKMLAASCPVRYPQIFAAETDSDSVDQLPTMVLWRFPILWIILRVNPNNPTPLILKLLSAPPVRHAGPTQAVHKE